LDHLSLILVFTLPGGFLMQRLLFITILCLSILFAVSLSMAGEFNVLIVVADSSALAESSVVQSFPQIEGNTFKFTEINIATGGTRPIAGGLIPADEVADGNLNWFDYQIIWFAWNGPGHDSDYFMEGTEEDLLKFAEDGGVIYMSAFDDNYRDAGGNQIGGWMPIDQFPCGVDNTGDADVEITPEGDSTPLFKVPNKLDDNYLSTLTLDDNLAPGSDEYVTLATRTDNNKPAIAMLPYGKGAYVNCCIDARSTFPAATQLMENMLNYLASLMVPQAVEPGGKLHNVWGDVKRLY
jgi:hypothetical protein